MNTKKKILIVGQSLPAVKQELPYDTTMLYEWLNEVGVSKNMAQDMFEFDAVYGYGFLGFNSDGSHKLPTQDDKDKYWNEVLKDRVKGADKIWIVGKVAEGFLLSKGVVFDKDIIITPHPSYRNRALYNRNKEAVLNKIKGLINN